jgi:hypothetical protein
MYPRKPKTITRRINLEKSINPDRLFIYENKSSIIYLDIEDILRLLDNKLKDKSLCEQKQIKYKDLIIRLRKNKKNGFVIIPTMKSADFNKMVGDLDTVKTGYAPLDFYSRGLTFVVSNSQWIPPYGYVPHYSDTLNSIKYDGFYEWIVSDLILKGQASIYRKSENELQDFVIYEIVDFRDGHGGESLLFRDNKIFMNVDIYSDLVMPDFECMDSTEIKQWGL